MSDYLFDWSDLAFGSKKRLKALEAIFIAAPREISRKRLIQLIKRYLPQGNVVFGLAKEDFVLELEGQPQFRMLQRDTMQPLLDAVNAEHAAHKVYALTYAQRDAKFIFEKVPFQKVILVNGSWYMAFHLRPEYYALTTAQTPYEMVSPFADEKEAQAYPNGIQLTQLPTTGKFTEIEMMELVAKVAKHSYDYGGFQIGAVLGRKKGTAYDLLLTAHNNVVPYETYAMHVGASREKNFSPMQDMNHYDTVHAEVALLLQAQKRGLDVRGAALFINLLPCPSCARMFTQTDVSTFVYAQDHSAGYAIQMLEKGGKKVRRLVSEASGRYN